MSVCPKCHQRLVPLKTDHGLLFRCRSCNGRAVGLSVLRRAIPPKIVQTLWMQARQERGCPGQKCPICRRTMIEVPVPAGGRKVPLDVCVGCQFAWFDPHEFEQFPARPRREEQPTRRPLPEKVREAMAMADLRVDKERQRSNDFGSDFGSDFGGESPDETWKWIPALLGMPVEHDVQPLRCWPWITWGVAAVMVLIFAASSSHLRQIVEQFGLVPAFAWRDGGLTFLTSFFLHADVFHLIGNAYFLLVFGDNVEDHLGRFRYVLLIAAAALIGDVLHIMSDPHSIVPCIGASGGISGVIVFYALKFPQARLGFMFRYFIYFRWFHMPAWFALVGWLVMQFVLAGFQIAGIGRVSALAHLGGATIGLVAWLMWREDREADSFAALRRDPGRRSAG